MICLTNSPRSRKELHDIFLQRTNAEITMGQYSKSEPVVVVEGVLDTKLVDKLRNRNLTVIPIEKLIKATIHEQRERKRTKSARELVEIVCNLFIENGFKFVFGIRDADTFALNEFVRNRKWNFKQKPSHVFDTRPCRDMETVLYSALHFGNKFVQNFPKKFDECVKRSQELAYVGLGLHKFNRSKVIRNWTPGLREFSNSYRSDRKKYYDLCESSEKITDAFINFHSSKFNEDTSQQFRKIIKNKKQSLKDMNFKWFELSRGHDLERMLQFTNQSFNGRKMNQLLIALVDYDCLKNYQLFKSINSWRVENNVPAFFK